ncbi:MAG TPA: MBL fold metallo-hydrolase [Pirellulales bacterium]|nr:MBL fold metallo-hydrolase [Pirellulales bacterium]
MKPLAWCMVTACFLAGGIELARAGRIDQRLDIYWVDVEGGAATLIVTPLGESVLIDTGNPGHRDPDRIVQTATREAGLRQLDHVIITHYHSDHFGGAATLATMLPIKHLHDNGIFEGLVDRPDKAYLELKSDRHSVVAPGEFIALEPLPAKDAPRLSLQCLGARQQYIAPPPGEPTNSACADFKPKPIDTTDNANSVVTLLSFGPFRFFDAGDLTWNLEKELVCPANRVGKVAVYQAGHHGLDASNNPLLIRALVPKVAVINNGTTKGCDPLMFATLKETPSIEAIYQVHRNLRNDGSPNAPDEYIANAAQACKANFVKLSVDPTGATFTMSVPSTGHSRTYDTR